MNLVDRERKINQLNDELAKLAMEVEKLKKEIAEDELAIGLKRTESERLAQNARGLEAGAKQKVGEKARAVKAVQSKEKEIKDEKQELFLKKRVIEQLERDMTVLTQDLAKLKQEKESKVREVENLKRQKDQIR